MDRLVELDKRFREKSAARPAVVRPELLPGELV